MSDWADRAAERIELDLRRATYEVRGLHFTIPTSVWSAWIREEAEKAGPLSPTPATMQRTHSSRTNPMTPKLAITTAEAYLRVLVTDLERIAREAGCDPKDEKACDGNECCCLLARANYLIDIIVCQTEVNPTPCCDKAYENYCEAVAEVKT